MESLVGRERARRAKLWPDPARGGHHGAVRDSVLTRGRRGGGEHQERGHVGDHDHLLPLPEVRGHDVRRGDHGGELQHLYILIS